MCKQRDGHPADVQMCQKKGMDTLLMPLSWWDMFPHQLAHSNEDAWARGLQVFPQACCSNQNLFHRSIFLRLTTMLLLAGTLDLGFSLPLDMLQSITMSQKVNNSQNACVILVSRIWWSAAHCRSGHPPLQIHCGLATLCPTAQGQLPGSEL